MYSVKDIPAKNLPTFVHDMWYQFAKGGLININWTYEYAVLPRSVSVVLFIQNFYHTFSIIWTSPFHLPATERQKMYHLSSPLKEHLYM